MQYGNLELLKSAHEIGRDLAKEAYVFCLTACGLEIPIDAIPTEPMESHMEIFNYLKFKATQLSKTSR